MSIRFFRASAAVSICVVLAACNPHGQRPGTWLTGTHAAFATDWGFTANEHEIAIEVPTPYLIPHSVTIWCASMDGKLYVGASNPESKRWPKWADAQPNVRIKVGDSVYEVHLAQLSEADEIERLRAVYAEKYQLNAGSGVGAIPSVEYWRVEPRS